MGSMIKKIKELREQTGVGVMAAKKVLSETDGDIKKAKELLVEKGFEKAEKKADREAKAGVVYAYIHTNGRVGAMVELNCETDFVGRNKEFKRLAKEIAMQVTSMEPESVEELLKQKYIRDGEKTIKVLLAEQVNKLGENIQIGRFVRYELGE